MSLVGEDDVEFARGIVNFASDEAARIQGMKCNQVESVLKRKTCKEVVYHDNLILLEK